MDPFSRQVRRDQLRAAAVALVAGVVFSFILGAALIHVGRPSSAAPAAVGAR